MFWIENQMDTWCLPAFEEGATFLPSPLTEMRALVY